MNMAASFNPADLLTSAAVPAFKCPAGTKMHILDLGTLEADESWYYFHFDCQFCPTTTNFTNCRNIGSYEVPTPAHWVTKTPLTSAVSWSCYLRLSTYLELASSCMKLDVRKISMWYVRPTTSIPP